MQTKFQEWVFVELSSLLLLGQGSQCLWLPKGHFCASFIQKGLQCSQRSSAWFGRFESYLQGTQCLWQLQGLLVQGSTTGITVLMAIEGSFWCKAHSQGPRSSQRLHGPFLVRVSFVGFGVFMAIAVLWWDKFGNSLGFVLSGVIHKRAIHSY